MKKVGKERINWPVTILLIAGGDHCHISVIYDRCHCTEEAFGDDK